MCGVPMHLSCMCAEPYDSYDGVQSGYLYSSLLRLRTWWGHRDQLYIYKGGGIYGSSVDSHTHYIIRLTLLPQSTLPTKVRPDVLSAALYAAQQVMGPATRSRRCRS